MIGTFLVFKLQLYLGVIWKTPGPKFLYYLVKPKVLHLRAVEGGVILCRCALVPKLTKFCQKTKEEPS